MTGTTTLLDQFICTTPHDHARGPLDADEPHDCTETANSTSGRYSKRRVSPHIDFVVRRAHTCRTVR